MKWHQSQRVTAGNSLLPAPTGDPRGSFTARKLPDNLMPIRCARTAN